MALMLLLDLSLALVLVPDPAPTEAVAPCLVAVQLALRNDTREPVTVTGMGMRGEGINREWHIDPVDAPAGGDWRGRVPVQLAASDPLRLHVQLRRGARSWRVEQRLRPSARLTETARQQCERSADAAACRCETPDRGRRCTDGLQCAGLCLFERIEAAPGRPCTPSPGLRCPVLPPMGAPVGRCAAARVSGGCRLVIPDGESAHQPTVQPSPRTMFCFNPAKPLARP